MSLDDVEKTSSLWPVDFFKVVTIDGQLCASAIFYRFKNSVVMPSFGVTMMLDVH
jgi:hypothetical protein